jgi:hypothetical protein
MPEEKIDPEKVLKGFVNRNSRNQFVVKGKGMKEYAVVGNPGLLNNREKYRIQKIRFTYDGHFAWLI